MAISKLTGPMLSNVLVRDGQGLAFSDSANSTPTLYIDIANARIGVNTDTPNTAFTINGAGYASSLNLTNNISLGGDVIANGNAIITNITASGNVSTVNLTATGFANAVNISASGNINATANIIAGNVNTVNLEATGFANAVNISASGNINAFANIVGGNVNAGNLTSTSNLNVSGSANISLLNVTNISVSGNISGNVTTSTTGNIDAGNLSITGTTYLGNINVTDTTISPIGNVVIFAGVTGVAVPIGNTSQRPGSPVAGTMRFNTENNDLETWSGTDWVNTAAQFTQILDQQITGTDATTYALAYPTDDNNSIIVSINGITQRPGAAYNVVGTDIEFANPLLTSEVADIRYLTYPVPVGEYGNANVAAYLATNTANLAGGNILSDNYLYANGTPINFSGGSYSNANVVAYASAGFAGNIIPSANVTYSLGNATNQWKDLWVSNNTIYINSVPISITPGNVLTVGGDNVITANSSTTGNINTTGNVSANYFVGNGSLLTNLPAATTGNLDIVDTVISIGASATSNIIAISPNIEGQAYVQVPNDAVANVSNVRIHNDAGNIEFGTNSGASLWYFDNTGNLVLPTDGDVNFDGGNIHQAQNKDFYVILKDQDNDDWGLYNRVNDGNDTTLSQTRLRRNEFTVTTDYNNDGFNWSFDNFGVLNLPGNINGAYAADTSVYAVNDGTTGSIELKTISFAGTALLSNVRVGNDNVTISTANAAHTWTFGNTGNLTFPDTTVQNTAWTGTTDSIANTGNSFTMSSSGVLSLAEGANSYLTLDRFGITAVTQMTIQSTNTDTGNNSAILFDRNGGGIAFRMEDVVANVPGSYNWGFYHSNVLFPDGTRQYTSYPGNATALSLSGNITADYFVGDGSLLTGITSSANTGNVTFSDITIQGTGDEYGGSGLYLAPGANSTANLQYLRVRGGDYPTHIHFDTGNNQYFDQYFGADNKFVKLEANGNVVINADDSGANSATWTFDTTGVVALPTISLGSGIDEQTTIQSQRKIIPPFRWSAEIANTTPTVVYTATNVNTTSMKVTIQVQHQGLGFEFFEVFATYTGSTDTYYVVNNRVAPPTIAPTTAEVSLTGSNVMEIILTVNSGAAASWVTYDAVEFGIPND